MPDPDGAGVILYTADKVLLHKRDEHPPQFPNYWGVFGGQMESQETPVVAAARETPRRTWSTRLHKPVRASDMRTSRTGQ